MESIMGLVRRAPTQQQAEKAALAKVRQNCSKSFLALADFIVVKNGNSRTLDVGMVSTWIAQFQNIASLDDSSSQLEVTNGLINGNADELEQLLAIVKSKTKEKEGLAKMRADQLAHHAQLQRSVQMALPDGARAPGASQLAIDADRDDAVAVRGDDGAVEVVYTKEQMEQRDARIHADALGETSVKR